MEHILQLLYHLAIGPLPCHSKKLDIKYKKYAPSKQIKRRDAQMNDYEFYAGYDQQQLEHYLPYEYNPYYMYQQELSELGRQPQALEKRVTAVERQNEVQTRELNRQNEEIKRLDKEIIRINQEISRLNQSIIRHTRHLNRLNQRLRVVENRLNIPFSATEDGF